MTQAATSSPRVALPISVVSSSLQPGYSCSCSSLLISFFETTTDKCAFVSAGYPIYSHFTTKHQSTQGAFNYGGTNATGQVPKLINNIGLVDPATPQSAYTKPSFQDPTQHWDLVFSDEFNVDGRTFWPGDDPYWEAVNLDYWQTVSTLVPLMRSVPTARVRVTWNGTIRSRPIQRMATFGSPSTLLIRSTITI